MSTTWLDLIDSERAISAMRSLLLYAANVHGDVHEAVLIEAGLSECRPDLVAAAGPQLRTVMRSLAFVAAGSLLEAQPPVAMGAFSDGIRPGLLWRASEDLTVTQIHRFAEMSAGLAEIIRGDLGRDLEVVG